MTIGEKILELRKINNMTQRDLASKLQVSNNTISRWETNRGLPDIDMIKSIALVFNISVQEIYGLTNDVEITPNKIKDNHRKKYILTFFIAYSLLLIYFTLIMINIFNIYEYYPTKVFKLICYSGFVICIISSIIYIYGYINYKIYLKNNPANENKLLLWCLEAVYIISFIILVGLSLFILFPK